MTIGTGNFGKALQGGRTVNMSQNTNYPNSIGGILDSRRRAISGGDPTGGRSVETPQTKENKRKVRKQTKPKGYVPIPDVITPNY